MKSVLISIFFVPVTISLFGQDNWVFKKERDGIKIYSRDSKYSRFNDLKVELDLTGNISQLSSIMLDVEKYKQWVYSTKSCVLVKKISNNELIYYSETEAPWPVSNRDSYAYLKITIDSVSRSLKMDFQGIKDYQPERKSVVRIPMLKSTWYVSTISERVLHLSFLLELDPGGIVPGWILNLFATKGPLESFKNLKQMMLLLNKSG